MEGFEINLVLRICHQVSDSDFDIFGVVNFEVSHFHGCDLSVEPIQDGHCECLLAFCPKVKIGEGESPGAEGCLSEVAEVWDEGDEAHDEITSPEGKRIPSGHSEIFIMGRHLFGPHQINECLYGLKL